MEISNSEVLEAARCGIASRPFRKDKSLRPYSSLSAQQGDGQTHGSLKHLKRSKKKGVIPSNQQLLSISGSVLTTGKHLTETRRRPYSASPALPIPITPLAHNQLEVLHYDSQLTGERITPISTPSIIEDHHGVELELSDDLLSIDPEETFADHVHNIRPINKYQHTGSN